MKTPKTIGEAADLLYKTKAKRLAKQKEVEALEAEEVQLKEYIIKTLPKSNASGVAGRVARVTVTTKEVVQVEDWPKFYKYVKANDAWDLLQRRVAPKAVEDRLEADEKIPGVKLFKLPTVSLNKV